MHKSSPNDIESNILPKLSMDNTTSDMSHTSSEHGGGGERVGLSVDFVKEADPTKERTHQSGGQGTGPEGTVGNRQSNEKVPFSGNSQQPILDVCLVITHNSLSENVQLENIFGTSPLECSNTTQKSDCQTDLEVCNDSSMLYGLEPCDDDTQSNVEMNGCDVDVSPDQAFKEFEVDPCATLEKFASDVSQTHKPCSAVDIVRTVEVLDGREKCSEKSDHSQQDDIKSLSCNNSIPVICDRGDQVCTGSVISVMIDEETGIEIEAKDYVADIQVKESNSVVTPNPSCDLCTVAEELPCYPELFRSLAACVVDEILDDASKRVSELSSIDVKEISIKHENISKQISDNGVQKVTKSPPEITAWVSENSDFALDGIDLRTTSHIKSSNDNDPKMVSENEKMPELSPCSCELRSTVEYTMQDQTPVICNGNILLSKQGNYLCDSKPILSCIRVSVTTDCDEVKNCVMSDLEDKAGSNDCSITSEFANKDAEYSSDIISMTDSIGEKEDVQYAMETVSSTVCLSEVNFVRSQGLKAKVDRSKDVSCGESSTEPISACLEDSSPSVELGEEMTGACFTISDLSIENSKNKNEDVVLNNQDQSLEVEKSQKDTTVVKKSNPNADETNFLHADPGLDSNVGAVGYLTSDCIPVEDVTVCSELSVAKVQGNTDGKDGSDETSFGGIPHRETESSHVPEDLVPEDTDEKASFTSRGTEDSIVNKPIVDIFTTLIGNGDGVSEEMETNVGEVIEKVISITEVSDSTAEKSDKDTGHAEKVMAITDEYDRTRIEPVGLTVVDVKAIPGKSESEKIDEVVEKKTANGGVVTAISSENECDSDKPETNYEEPIGRADTIVPDTFQVDTAISDEEPIDDPLASRESAEEISSDLPSEVPIIPQIKLERIPLNSGGQDVEKTFPTDLCQFTVPIVNVCPPITEETYDGLTDDESEISHATSDSESDSNFKMVKPVCDGVNTINYRPLLEEDSNDRSTLSLISELDEASVREDNAETEQWENESASLISDDGVDRLENTVSSCEVVQRVKGQRIRPDKMTVELEENSYSEEECVEEDIPCAEYAVKIKDIREALKCNDSSERLRSLAQSAGGLVADEIRKEAWPRLLGIDMSTLSSPLPPINTEELHAHKEYNQVVLDVNRSLRRFPSKISDVERANLQNQLTEIIVRVLMKRGNLCYYQGYHDVAVTTLLVAGKDIAFHILERISVSHLSDCMLPTMERTSYLLNYIYPLLQRINPSVVERMDRLEIGTIFCLPWYLTWYGYSLNRYEDIVRVFDYFLASPPLAPLYLAAVVVGRRSAEVLAADSDQATVHSLLSRIPESLPLEDLLQEALYLYRQYPPEKIKEEVEDRWERLRKAQKEEEEQRRLIRLKKMSVQRRHSMPSIAARQMPGWYYLDRFLGIPAIQRNRLIPLSATVFLGFIAWHWRYEMSRYF